MIKYIDWNFATELIRLFSQSQMLAGRWLEDEGKSYNFYFYKKEDRNAAKLHVSIFSDKVKISVSKKQKTFALKRYENLKGFLLDIRFFLIKNNRPSFYESQVDALVEKMSLAKPSLNLKDFFNIYTFLNFLYAHTATSDCEFVLQSTCLVIGCTRSFDLNGNFKMQRASLTHSWTEVNNSKYNLQFDLYTSKARSLDFDFSERTSAEILEIFLTEFEKN